MKKNVRNIILFDDNEVRKHLMPFTYTRPTAQLRVGITTISEKWQSMLGEATYSYLTVRYLKKKYPLHVRRTTNLMVAGHVIPTPELAQQVLDLEPGEALMVGEELIAFNGTATDYDTHHYTRIVYPKNLPLIVGEFGYNYDNGHNNLRCKADHRQILATCHLLGYGFMPWSWTGNNHEHAWLDMVDSKDWKLRKSAQATGD